LSTLKTGAESLFQLKVATKMLALPHRVALSMFDGDDLAEAIGVPFFYGLVEAIVVGVYCVIAWKIGWTKAPKNVSLWKAISTSYEIEAVEEGSEEVEEKCDTSVDDAESDGFHYVPAN
jgi:hypothetical protein